MDDWGRPAAEARRDRQPDRRHRAANDLAPIFIIGSHVDTVPDAGKYDGVLGVLLGIAAAALSNAVPLHHLDVIAFSEEEGVASRTPIWAAWLPAGYSTISCLLADARGVTLAQAVADFGSTPPHWHRQLFCRDQFLDISKCILNRAQSWNP